MQIDVWYIFEQWPFNCPIRARINSNKYIRGIIDNCKLEEIGPKQNVKNKRVKSYFRSMKVAEKIRLQN